jgi:hypothetical protein
MTPPAGSTTMAACQPALVVPPGFEPLVAPLPAPAVPLGFLPRVTSMTPAAPHVAQSSPATPGATTLTPVTPRAALESPAAPRAVVVPSLSAHARPSRAPSNGHEVHHALSLENARLWSSSVSFEQLQFHRLHRH